MSALVVLATAALTLGLQGQVAGAQARRLTMTVSSTLVSPGDSIVVTLDSPAGESFRGIMLIGTPPIGMAGTTSSLPAKFSIKIPPETVAGTYGLAAVAVTVAGEELMAKVELGVERRGLPVSIVARWPALTFLRQGDELPLSVRANYASDDLVDISDSDRLTFRSLNPKVAIVDGKRLLAIGPGATTVIATFTYARQQRQVMIPVTVPAPPFRVTPNPLDFGSQTIGTSASAQYTITNTTETPLRIVKVGTPGEEFGATDGCVLASPLAAGASCSIGATFTPERPGYKLTFIRFETGDDQYGLSLSGTGVAPATSTPSRTAK